jgi:glutaredoxin 3
VGLSADQRRRNVAGVFRVDKSRAGVQGKLVVVVDDVITTGATADTCARALNRAKAARVDVWRWPAPSSPPPSCSSLAPSLIADQLSCRYFEANQVSRILLYTTPFCGYCRAAKTLLRGKALDFEEIDVSFDAEKRAEMVQRAMGLRTVPQIFIHGRHVGGYDELAALEREGRLEALLADAAEAIAGEP